MALSGINGLSVAFDGTTVLAGTQDGLMKAAVGTTSWTQADSKVNTATAPVSGLVVNGTRVIASLAYNGIYYTDDLGASWTEYDNNFPGTSGNRPTVNTLGSDGTVLLASLNNTQTNQFQVYRASAP